MVVDVIFRLYDSNKNFYLLLDFFIIERILTLYVPVYKSFPSVLWNFFARTTENYAKAFRGGGQLSSLQSITSPGCRKPRVTVLDRPRPQHDSEATSLAVNLLPIRPGWWPCYLTPPAPRPFPNQGGCRTERRQHLLRYEQQLPSALCLQAVPFAVPLSLYTGAALPISHGHSLLSRSSASTARASGRDPLPAASTQQNSGPALPAPSPAVPPQREGGFPGAPPGANPPPAGGGAPLAPAAGVRRAGPCRRTRGPAGVAPSPAEGCARRRRRSPAAWRGSPVPARAGACGL